MTRSHRAKRWSAHLSLPEVGERGQERLLASKIAIVGLGGLGNPASLYLASSGVGQLTLIDHDTICESNLPRQVLYCAKDIGKAKVDRSKEQLQELSPHTTIITHQKRLHSTNALELLKGHDLILDCCDNFDTRYLINDTCRKLDLPWVHASLHRFEAQLTLFDQGQKGCYRCLYPQKPSQKLRPRCSEAGILAPVAGNIGLRQALEALKYLLNLPGSLKGQLLHLNLLHNHQYPITIQPDPNCSRCNNPQAPLDQDLARYVSLENNRNQLVDLREEEEFQRGSFPGSLNLPLSKIEDLHSSLLDPNQSFCLFCRTGKRARTAFEYLKKEGYSQLTLLSKGYHQS